MQDAPKAAEEDDGEIHWHTIALAVDNAQSTKQAVSVFINGQLVYRLPVKLAADAKYSLQTKIVVHVSSCL